MKMELPLHPYFPLGILLSGTEFVPNTFGTLALVAVFAIGCAVILGSALLIAIRINPGLKRSDRLLVIWFVLCELMTIDTNASFLT
jgi:cholestenol delta-isomerase